MTIRTDFADFRADVELATRGGEEAALAFRRDTEARVGELVVDGTPVDTALLRGSWRHAVTDSPDETVPTVVDPSGSATKAAIRARVDLITSLGQPSVLHNNQPYAEHVENGTANRPPVRMLARAIERVEAESVIPRARLFPRLRGVLRKFGLEF